MYEKSFITQDCTAIGKWDGKYRSLQAGNQFVSGGLQAFPGKFFRENFPVSAFALTFAVLKK
jgi:hypothetical protein